MIKLYTKDETSFTTNGIGVLDHDISHPVVEEFMNGAFTFTFDYPIFAINGTRIAEQMIVTADDPENKDQRFRILKIEKDLGMLTVTALHIFYDLNDNWVEDTNIVGKNGNDALNQMAGKLNFPTALSFYSDIDTVANSQVVKLKPTFWLLDPQTDNSFTNRWGGEIKRINNRVWMLKHRGSDNGVQIRWRKNLAGYHATWDYQTITTRVRPTGFDGLSLPELYIDSPLIDKYTSPKVQEIKYEDVKAIDPNSSENQDDAVPLEQALAELRTNAANEFSVNHVDEPSVSVSVDMLALQNTREYSGLKSLEQVGIWDTIKVINEKDGMNVTVRMNHYQWDPLRHAYIQIELGNTETTVTSSIGISQSQLNQTTQLAESALSSAVQAQMSADGKNKIYRGSLDPTKMTIVGAVEGDQYYWQNGDKVSLWHFDGRNWVLDIDDMTGVEVSKRVDSAAADAESAKSAADNAVNQANDAVASAGFAKVTAVDAKGLANSAAIDAANAQTTARSAAGDALDAATSAVDAKKSAGEALSNASSAFSAASQAINEASANGAAITSQGLAIKSTASDVALKADKVDVNSVKQQVTSQAAQLAITNSDIALKADKSTTDLLTKTIDSQTAQLTVQAGQIQSKADSSKVDAINNTVQSMGAQLTVEAGQIVTKADKSTVDNLTGTVNTLGTQITTQAGLIAAKLNSSDLDGLINAKGFATQNYVQNQINVTSNGLTASISQVSQQLNNLSVGGRNYLLNSDQTLVIDGDNDHFKIVYAKLTPGTWTISGNASYTRGSDSNVTVAMYDDMLGPSGYASNPQLIGGRFKTTMVAKTGITKLLIYAGGASWGSTPGKTLQVDHLKLEQGNVATDWSPAPEDKANQTDLLNVQATAQQVQIGLTNITGDLNATKTIANNLQAQAGSFSATLSSMTNQLDNMSVGGRNYILNSANQITINGDNEHFKAVYENMTPGEWTFSANVNYTVGATDKVTVLFINHDWSVGTQSVNAPIINGKIKATLTAGPNDTTVLVYAGPNGWASTPGHVLQIDHYKLEKGNVATDWSPAPEDSATVDQFVNLQANLNGLQSTVTNYQTGTQSQLTQLSGQLTSTISDVYDAKNGQSNLLYGTFNNLTLVGQNKSNQATSPYNINRIALGKKVTLAYKISSTVAGGTAYPQFIGYPMWGFGAPTVNLTTSQQWCTFTTTLPTDSDTSKPFQIQWRCDNVPNGATVTVWQAQMVLGSTPLSSWQQAPQDNANLSQITQMQGDINLRVMKNFVVSEINMDSSGLYIHGEKISISGQTYIEYAAIKDAAIASLSANKLTAGTIDANTINLINLNASNITAGIITGPNLSINLMTGAVNFQHGSISGNAVSINLDTGYINFQHGIIHGQRINMNLDTGDLTITGGQMHTDDWRFAIDLNSAKLWSFIPKNGDGTNTFLNGGFTITGGVIEFWDNWGEANQFGSIGKDMINGGIGIRSSHGASMNRDSGTYVNVGWGDKPNNVVIGGSTMMWNDLSVLGSKNAVHPTRDGIRATPAYETAESYLGDIGESTTGDGSTVRVPIETLFGDTVNTSIAYQVFLQSYSSAHVWVSQRSEAFFVVESDQPNASFSWEIKAKRRGYENDRLVKQDIKYSEIEKVEEQQNE